MVTLRKPRRPAKPSTTEPPQDVAWSITRLTATPAKSVGIVYAPDETTAIARAIEQFNPGGATVEAGRTTRVARTGKRRCRPLWRDRPRLGTIRSRRGPDHA